MTFPQEPVPVPPIGDGPPPRVEQPGAVPPGAGLSRPECRIRHRAARFNRELREFELQCPACLAKCRQSYWPLTLEFWSEYGVGKCKACRAEDDRARQRARRQDEATRLADNRKVAAWREANPGYGTVTTRAWRQANRERDRAQNHARYLARKAARAA